MRRRKASPRQQKRASREGGGLVSSPVSTHSAPLKSSLKKPRQQVVPHDDQMRFKKVIVHREEEAAGEGEEGEESEERRPLVVPKVVRREGPCARPPRAPSAEDSQHDIHHRITKKLMKPIDDSDQELLALDRQVNDAAVLEEVLLRREREKEASDSLHHDEVTTLQEMLDVRERSHLEEVRQLKDVIAGLESKNESLEARIDELSYAEGMHERAEELQKFLDDTEKIHKMEVRKYRDENEYFESSIKELREAMQSYATLSSENRIEHRKHSDAQRSEVDMLKGQVNNVRRRSRLLEDECEVLKIGAVPADEIGLLRHQIMNMKRMFDDMRRSLEDERTTFRAKEEGYLHVIQQLKLAAAAVANAATCNTPPVHGMGLAYVQSRVRSESRLSQGDLSSIQWVDDGENMQKIEDRTADTPVMYSRRDSGFSHRGSRPGLY